MEIADVYFEIYPPTPTLPKKEKKRKDRCDQAKGVRESKKESTFDF